MYGTVNMAVQDLVVSNYGEDTWTQLKRKAGVDTETFVRMEGYDDDVTYRLVGAASQMLGVSADQVLETFGHFWVKFTADKGYGEMMSMCGNTLPDFLRNLDTLHARVGMTYSNLRPPTFEVEEENETTFKVHYRSERAGLGAMVTGLLKGLADKFGAQANIEHTAKSAEGADHDEFMVSIQA